MYELWLTNDAGLRLAQLDYNLGFSASRVANGCGWFEGLFAVDFDTTFIKPDFMIQVWVYNKLWRVYLIRKWRWETSGNVEHLKVSGPCISDLLRRRIVAAYAGSTTATKTDYADDMMKVVVTQALLNTAAPVPTAGTRAWPSLTVAAEDSLAPSITKAFAWESLLTSNGGGLLPAICQASAEAGTDLYFDIVPNVVSSSAISFLFQTFTNQPGLDVSDKVTFSKENGNLADPYIEQDWSEEANYAYAAGQGEKTLRNVQQVYVAARYGISQWNRCETMADARDQATNAGVQAAGYRALRDGMPKRRFGGVPVDTEGTRFGRDWDFGYRVATSYRGVSYITTILGMAIGVGADGKPFVQAKLGWEE